MKLSLVFASSLIALSLGCSASSPTTANDTGPVIETPITPPGDDTPDPRLEGRPYAVRVPPAYDAAKATPLVLAFHGYGDGDDGPMLEKYFKIGAVADAEGFLYVTPNGTKDSVDERFWNGTDACCDFDKKRPDDVGYVRAVVADIAKHYNVDAKRIYAVGLSGGGFFVHRLACDASDLFAAVISVSAATYADGASCTPKGPVSVVEIHGEKDEMVAYTGGTLEYGGSKAKYPSAHDTVARWAGLDGCTGALTKMSSLDLVSTQAGDETTVERYEGCPKGAVELWTVKDGVHAPRFGAGFAKALWGFFSAHPKPWDG